MIKSQVWHLSWTWTETGWTWPHPWGQHSLLVCSVLICVICGCVHCSMMQINCPASPAMSYLTVYVWLDISWTSMNSGMVSCCRWMDRVHPAMLTCSGEISSATREAATRKCPMHWLLFYRYFCYRWSVVRIWKVLMAVATSEATEAAASVVFTTLASVKTIISTSWVLNMSLTSHDYVYYHNS